MDWSQFSIGAIAGTAGTWFLGGLKVGWEHWLEERKHRAADVRVIRAEEREEARKDAERQRARTENLEKDEATLLMYKTQVKGCTEETDAANIVKGIHSFFIQRPEYLRLQNNAVFLEKYPGNLPDFVAYDTTYTLPLEELKSALDLLQLRPPQR